MHNPKMFVQILLLERTTTGFVPKVGLEHPLTGTIEVVAVC